MTMLPAPEPEPARSPEAEPLLEPSTTDVSHRAATTTGDDRCDDGGHALSCAGARDHDSGLKIPAAMFGFLLQGLFNAGVGVSPLHPDILRRPAAWAALLGELGS